ncbi:hypothetical protein [Mucilaginibacter sp. dw_454]|uniref:hypothetical protein n=1 Tax=Mucilaginibacter sp. dw_454 TaxID=2720079 RepID=UPI001BD6A74E|nr:hypothetical protein [Mucilaginibacter sp. dw_454]
MASLDIERPDKKSDPDFYDDLPQCVKDGIEQGLQDVESGNVHSHEEVMTAARLKYISTK